MNAPRLYRCVTLLGLLLCLSACTVKLSYKFLDNLLSWQINQYVSLNSEQKKITDSAIDAFHDWHRHTQLTLYADYLEALRDDLLSGPTTADYLHKKSNALQDLLDQSMDELMPTITSVASTLDEEQIQEVLTRMRKDQEEYRDDYIDDDDKRIQKRRIRNITRYLGGFFGKFTDEQKQRLNDWESNLEPYETLMLAQQEQWEHDFVDAMNFQDQPDKLQSKLRALMLYRTDNWNPELQKQLDINQENTFIMIADLFNSQSDKQKQKMERKFNHYIDDLRDLAK